MSKVYLLSVITLIACLGGCGGGGSSSGRAAAEVAESDIDEVPPFDLDDGASDNVDDSSLEGTWLAVGSASGPNIEQSQMRIIFNITSDNGVLKTGNCWSRSPISLTLFGESAITLAGFHFTIIDNVSMTSTDTENDAPTSGSYDTWEFEAKKINSLDYLVEEELTIEKDTYNETLEYGNCVIESVTQGINSDAEGNPTDATYGYKLKTFGMGNKREIYVSNYDSISGAPAVRSIQAFYTLDDEIELYSALWPNEPVTVNVVESNETTIQVSTTADHALWGEFQSSIVINLP